MPTTVTSSGAVTLADYAKRSNCAFERKFIKNIYRTSNILKDLRMKDDGVRLTAEVERLGNAGLGSVSWVNLGEKGDVYSADTTIHGEAAFLIRNRIECDHLLLKAKPRPVNDPIDIRTKAFAESLQFELNDTFFNNTPSANTKAWVGLRHRIANYSQYKVHSGVDINAAATDLSISGASTANALLFLQYVDETLAQLGNTEGDNCVMYMDGSVMRSFQRALKAGTNVLRNDKDAYERNVTMYKNMKLVDTGYKQDRSTRVMPIDENASGVSAASVYTSAFIVDYSDGAFGAWKFGGFSPTVMGIDPSNDVLWRASFEFGCGLAPATDNCFARIRNIKAA